MPFDLVDFVRESNRIEGIHRMPTKDEIAAHGAFLKAPQMVRQEMELFVGIVAPGNLLRRKRGMNVRVGSYIAPAGGPDIERELEKILSVTTVGGSAYYIHQLYETLHPFTDGNGRSGRALWLWMMGGIERAPLGFLHHWYYQSLESERE